MLRLRIGNMRRLSAEFVVLLLLCASFICGEAAPGIFFRRDVSSTKMIVHLGSMHRKILQDQPTSTSAESKDANVQKTDQGVDERKWEPKENEKTEWIAEPTEDEKAAHQVKNAERKQIMVGKKNEASNEGLTVEKEQSKSEEKNDEWHQAQEAESKQIRVGKEARYQEPKADMERTQLEKKGEALHQDLKAQAEETKVDEKEKPDEEWKMARKEVGNVEPNADEKSENKRESNEREEKPVVRFEDEEWKVAKVEEKRIEKLEQKLVDKKKEEPRVEESSEDSHVGETMEVSKGKEEEERYEVEERKELKVEDRKEEPKIDNIKDAPEVKEKNLEPIQDIEKVDKIAENDERNVVENKVQEDALKVLDKKEEDAVELKNESKKDKDGKSSISSKIEEKPVKTENIQETHSEFDEDYPDFLDELRNFPERFQKTAESVKDHISNSGLRKYSTHSKELFNQANQQIQESFTPLLGKDYAPFLAYLVSYGLLLLPLAIVAYLLDRIRARYSLQKILLFVNIYLAAYFAALLAVALVLDTEPMKFFMQYSSSSYIFLQLLQAFGYLIYLLLNSADLISTCSNGRIAAKFSSVLQWVVVIAVGFHYYVTVFHRAMARKAPLTGPKIYALYSISFLFLCLFARIERGKKQYTPKEVDDTTDKKN